MSEKAYRVGLYRSLSSRRGWKANLHEIDGKPFDLKVSVLANNGRQAKKRAIELACRFEKQHGGVKGFNGEDN